MREFIVDLAAAETREEFVAAFNAGFCVHVDGSWRGKSWDALHDYLSWPKEERYRLVLRGWRACRCLEPKEKKMVADILADNPHVDSILS